MPDSRIPSASVPAVDSRGLLSQAWYRFFANILGPAPAFSTVAVGASPFTWDASRSGHVLIAGGTVSSVKIQRGVAMLTVPSGLVPVAQGDAVIVTYSVLPSMTFIPE